MEIFPNPITGSLQIVGQDAGPLDIYLFDMTGKPVRQFLSFSGQQLEVGELPVGIYLIRVVQGGRVYAGRFVRR